MLPLSLLLACSAPAPAPEPSPELSERITWAQPTPVNEVPIATLFAQVVSGPDGAINLSPGVSGRILAWRVAPGSAVEPGTPLAELVSPELSDLLAEVQSLQAQLDERRALLETREREQEAGLISLSALRQAHAEVQRLELELAAERRRLGAHEDGLSRQGQRWIWRASVAGTVASLDCAVGSVEGTDDCLTLRAEGGTPLLELPLPERYLDRAQGPLRAELVLEGGDTRSFTELSRTPTLDPSTRTQGLRFTPTGADAPMPGRSGRATLWSPRDAFALPPEALSQQDGAPVVFVDGPEGPEALPVTVLGAAEGQRFVTGLSADDRVAVGGVFLLKSLLATEAL